MNELPVILCERLTPEEEIDFLCAINDAQAQGEITPEEATQMIDREYELQAAIAR